MIKYFFTMKASIIWREQLREAKLDWQDKPPIPNQLAKAIYCSLWACTGISLAISWWIIGKNGGQFFPSSGTPADTWNREKGNYHLRLAFQYILKLQSCRFIALTFCNRILSPFDILNKLDIKPKLYQNSSIEIDQTVKHIWENSSI